MRIKVCEPVKKNGKWELIEYEKEEEFPNSEGRHSDLCVVCGFPTYPECREWCRNEKLEAMKS
ncbi:MAG: hypothetical protein LBR74_03695 [Eubacterium sp.]|jgi:hypothetical protein|nr:hypothetical protein [Eubacterium sp.]